MLPWWYFKLISQQEAITFNSYMFLDGGVVVWTKLLSLDDTHIYEISV